MADRLTIRDALVTTLEGVAELDVVRKGVQATRELEGSKITAMVIWQAEDLDDYELHRRQGELDLGVILVTKSAGGGMTEGDDRLAEAASAVQNAVETQTAGAFLGLSAAPSLVKDCAVVSVDPMVTSEAEAREGWVYWSLTVRAIYRYTRGGA